MSASGPTRLRNARRGRPSSRVGGRTDPALALLRQAEFWVDATRSSVVGGKLKNLGSGGSALDATFGSTAPSAYFDGTAMVLPGVAGNYASTPDAAALQPATQIEMVARLSADDWTPAASAAILGKWTGAATPPAVGRSYQFFVTSSVPAGRLGIQWSDSTTSYSVLSTVVPSFVDGTTYWVKTTLNTNSGGNYEVKFFTAPDQSAEPSSWTQLGTTVTAAASGAIVYTTNVVEVGAGFGGTSNVLAGKFYRTIVRNGIAGTTVFDADFAKPFDTTSFIATTGQTVTLTRSTSGVDTNDPTLLPHTGTNYLYLPGSATNNWTIPDAAALDITGDIEVVRRFAADDWTPASTGSLVRRSTLVDPNRAWDLVVTTGGNIQFSWYPTGSAASGLFKTSTVAAPFTDGTAYWIKATLDVDNGAAGNTVRIYWAADSATEPSSWTQLGADIVTAGVTSLPDVATGVAGGEFSGTGYLAGKDYRTIVRNGIGGTTVVDIDFTTGITSGGQTSFTASTGQTVSIFRATSGRKAVAVTRPIVLMGTDDYLTATDSTGLLDLGASQDMTAVIVSRHWNATPGFRSLMGNRANGVVPNGWELDNSNGIIQASVGVSPTPIASASGGAWTAGSLLLGAMIRDSAGLRVARNSTVSSNVSTATFYDSTINASKVLNIGARWNGTSDYTDFEFVAAAVFRRALTAAEIAAIVSYYGAA